MAFRIATNAKRQATTVDQTLEETLRVTFYSDAFQLSTVDQESILYPVFDMKSDLGETMLNKR